MLVNTKVKNWLNKNFVFKNDLKIIQNSMLDRFSNVADFGVLGRSTITIKHHAAVVVSSLLPWAAPVTTGSCRPV